MNEKITYGELVNSIEKELKRIKRINIITNICMAIAGSMIGSYLMNKRLFLLIIGLVLLSGVIVYRVYRYKELSKIQ